MHSYDRQMFSKNMSCYLPPCRPSISHGPLMNPGKDFPRRVLPGIFKAVKNVMDVTNLQRLSYRSHCVLVAEKGCAIISNL